MAYSEQSSIIIQKNYAYPFASTREEGREATPPINCDYALNEDYKNSDGVYCDPGFNLGGQLQELRAPLVEVGGPTVDGYNILNNVDLPSRPIIINKDAQEFTSFDGHVISSDVNPPLYLPIDVRNFPFDDSSLGAVCWSCLDKITPIDNSVVKDDELDSIIEQRYTEALSLSQKSNRSDLLKNNVARIAATAQAARTLKPGGVLITKDAGPLDVELAHQLGFRVVMHTPIERWSWAEGNDLSEHDEPREVVFQKIK